MDTDSIKKAQDGKFQCCFVNTDMQTPISTKHIAYYTTRGMDYDSQVEWVALNEVVELTYRHPDAPDHATVRLTTTRPVLCEKDARSLKAAHIRLLEDAQNNSRSIVESLPSIKMGV